VNILLVPVSLIAGLRQSERIWAARIPRSETKARKQENGVDRKKVNCAIYLTRRGYEMVNLYINVFRSLFGLDLGLDAFTRRAVGLIAYVAIGTFVILHLKHCRLQRVVRRFVSETGEWPRGDPGNILKINELLSERKDIIGRSWRDYYTLARSELERRSSIESAAVSSDLQYPDFRPVFSYQRLIRDYTNRRAAEIVPPSLTASGILFTFIGLVMGFAQVEVSDVQVMRQSISSLLGGMQVAFHSSIVAIFSSIVWSWLDRATLRRSESKLDQLHSHLDRLLPIGEETTLLQRLVSLQEEQLDGVKTLVTDVMLPGIVNGLDDAVNASLVPSVQQAMDAVKAFAGQTGQTQVDGIDKLVTKMLDKFEDAFDGRVQALSESLGRVVEWQDKVNHSMDELVADVQAAAGRQQEVMDVSASVLSNASAVADKLEGIAKLLGPGLSELKEVADTLELFALEVQENVNHLLESEKRLSEVKDSYITQLEQQQAEAGALWQSICKHVADLNAGIENAAGKMLEQLHKGLEFSFSQFDKELGKAVARFRAVIGSMSDPLEDLPPSIERLASLVGQLNAIGDRLVQTSSLYREALERPPVVLRRRSSSR